MTSKSRIRFQVEDEPRSGIDNMRVDRELLGRVEETSEPQTWIRFYRWETPTVSLGKHQIPEQAADLVFCRRNGIPVVTRPTGGRAVFHGRELTYSVVSNDSEIFPSSGIAETYRIIAEALRDGLAAVGVRAQLASAGPSRSSSPDGLRNPCFMTPSRDELVFAGRKMAGSAQRRLRRSFLQHGSIPLLIDYPLMAGALGSDAEALKGRVISVSEAAGRDVSYKRLAAALKASLERGLNCSRSAGCATSGGLNAPDSPRFTMAEREEPQNLDERAADILKALIREFVRTSKPVGSRRLAKIHVEHLSPATIRNVVADLEEQGYVAQPHTSAGRVPTAKGYRFYVDSLAETQTLPDADADRIKRSLGDESDPDALMNKTSQLLSSISNNVGFVLAPPISMTVMKHLEFVKISARRVLVILVAKTGLVQHRLIRVEEELKQSELDQASRYLVRHYEGKTLSEIREELIKLMSEEKALYDRMLQNVILLGSASLMREEPGGDSDSEVYLGGTARIIEKPELADVNRMMTLFQTFEEKSRLVKVLTECVRGDQSRPTVTIGLEKHIPGMRDLALISSPYFYDQGVTGTLGILGPSRMEYEKAIGLVDYVAKLFGQLLANNYKRQ